MKDAGKSLRQNRVYADWAATSPLCPPAKRAMIEAMDTYGNPSSLHNDGIQAKKIVETAREQVAELINADPDEIYFTSGATEANCWALSGSQFPIISEIEHHSVLNRPGRSPHMLICDGDGVVHLGEEATSEWIGVSPSLCSVMAVNNETGVIQNIQEICDWAHRQNMWFHTDATQAVGHIPVDVKAIGCDMLSMSAHKFCGPKGVGALYIKRGTPKTPLLYGGAQESGMRPGTENVIGIAGMGAAAQFCMECMPEAWEKTQSLQRRIEVKVLLSLNGVKIAGAGSDRLSTITDFLFDGVEGPALVVALDQRNVSASSGSACSEGTYEPSHVLKAMGLENYGALRISIGWSTTAEEADYIAQSIIESVKELRR